MSLLVVQVRGSQVSVLGQVGRPGRYPVETADMRLSDLLATAGGIAPGGADIVTLVGTRNGQPFRRELDLQSIVRSDRRADDLFVQNGDVLFVDRAPVVYIYGEVQRPGTLRLERGMTLMQVLAASGGITAARHRKRHAHPPQGRRRQDAGAAADDGRPACAPTTWSTCARACSEAGGEVRTA